MLKQFFRLSAADGVEFVLPIEAKLILCSARGGLGLDKAQIAESLSLIDQIQNWNKVLNLAAVHGLQPLLYQNLMQAKSVDDVGIPEFVISQLHECVYAATSRNLLLTSELINLVQLFAQHSIEVIAFKGPTLALCAYGNLALRQFYDLDLLIEPQNILRAKNLLQECGFVSQHHFKDSKEEKRHLDFDCEYNMIQPDYGFIIELHWKIRPRVYPVSLGFKDLQDYISHLNLGRIAVPTLEPEMLLFVLCLHGEKHCWGRANWVCDVSQLIQSTPHFRWEAAIEYAENYKSEEVLFLGVLLAQKLIGVNIPAWVEQRISTYPKLQNYAAQLGYWLFSPSLSPQRKMARSFFHASIRQELRHKVSYMTDTLTRSVK